MKYVALLRGINVGGKNSLPMKDLATMFTDAGCTNVRTYIQSGNVVFEAQPKLIKKLPETITAQINQRFGYKVPVILRTADEITAILKNNPFLQAGEAEKMLHVYFLSTVPAAASINNLDQQRSPPDRFHVHDRQIYLHLPNGMGNSKLSNVYFDSKLSTICTARNWATVLKLAAMMDE